MGCKIIVINGSPQSGKDTFIDSLRELNLIKVFNLSSVDKIKDSAKFLGWSGFKDDQSRKFLSDLKQLSINFNNGPINYLVDEITKIIDNYSNAFIFCHIREEGEINKLQAYFTDLIKLKLFSSIKLLPHNVHIF